MSEILQETTIWTGHYGACNHTYLLDNQNKIIAYIKQNDIKVNILKTQTMWLNHHKKRNTTTEAFIG